MVEHPQEGVEAVYGRNATLTCVIRGEEGAPLTVTWSRDDGVASMVTMVTNVTTTDVQSVVVIEDVTEEGVYRCTGTFTGDNPGTVVSDPVTISILGTLDISISLYLSSLSPSLSLSLFLSPFLFLLHFLFIPYLLTTLPSRFPNPSYQHYRSPWLQLHPHLHS